MFGILGGIAGALIQNAGAKKRNEQQFAQQQQLMDKTFQQNKAMALFNQEQQMQMWKDTGPVGQMAQLKKAGLNPALIYGMGGAGGQTAQAAQGQGQSTPTANVENTMAGMGILGTQIGQQIELLKAQKENIQADTDKKRAETPGEGQTIEKIGAEIENLKQSTTTEKAKQYLTEVQTDITKIQKEIASSTMEDAIEKISDEAQIIHYDMIRGIRQNWIEEKTAQSVIDTTKLTYFKLLADKLLTEQQTQESKQRVKESQSNILLNNAQITSLLTQRLQEARKIEIAGGHLNLEKFLHDTPDSTGMIANLAGKLASIVAALGIFKGLKGKGREGIGFKPQKY